MSRSFGRDVVDHPVADAQGPLGDLLESGDHPQLGGLAAPRGTDQDHELAIPDLEVHVLHDGEVAVDLDDVVECHGGHASTSTPIGIAGSCIQPPKWNVDEPRT